MYIPEVPFRVLAKHKGGRRGIAAWWYTCTLKGPTIYFRHADVHEFVREPRDLRVVDHPRNDPEAVAIIETPKRKRKQ